MSRLSTLLRQVESIEPQLAANLQREVDALSSRRAFGLNFERHIPETVELPGRPVRKGDKVRFLPERGAPANSVDRRIWRVAGIRRADDGRVADLVRRSDRKDQQESASRACDDLVVVAEFRDPIYPGLKSTGKASETLPRRAARPIKRLLALAQALSRDGLMDDARKRAKAEMCRVLDGLLARHKEQVDKAGYDILEVAGETKVMKVGDSDVSDQSEEFTEIADDRAVDADFRTAGRVLTLELARSFAEHITVAGGDDDGLFDAHVKVAALSRIDGVADDLDREAGKLADKWLGKYRVEIKKLSPERRAEYDDIIAMTTEPQRIDIERPRVRTEETEPADGSKVATRGGHLMSDEKGQFPVGSLNTWEIPVLDTEMERPDFRAWYRSPQRRSADALAVAYEDGQGRWRRMFPDFLFFHGDDSEIRVSIVDPHGHHLSDALPKLRGLARFTEEFGDEFHRVESVARMDDGTLRVLDLTKKSVRAAVRAVKDAKDLYLSDTAADYLT